MILRSPFVKTWRQLSRRGRFPGFRCWLARTVPQAGAYPRTPSASSSINHSLRYRPSASLLEPPWSLLRCGDCCSAVASHQAVHSISTGPSSFDMNTRGQSSQPYPAVVRTSLYMPRRRWPSISCRGITGRLCPSQVYCRGLSAVRNRDLCTFVSVHSPHHSRLLNQQVMSNCQTMGPSILRVGDLTESLGAPVPKGGPNGGGI